MKNGARYLIIICSALALLGGYAFGLDAVLEPPLNAGEHVLSKSLDREEELLTRKIAGRAFRIPKRYSFGVASSGSGSFRTFLLRGKIPSFEMPPGQGYIDSSPYYSTPEDVILMVDISPRPWHFRRFTQELKSWSESSPQDMAVAKKSFAGIRYNTLIDPRFTSQWGIVPEKGYFFSCSVASSPELVSLQECSAKVDYDENISLNLRIRQVHLDKLEKVIESSIALLKRHQI